MNLRTREIKDVGPFDIRKVFPLSPSTVTWDALGGCPFRRIVSKGEATRAKMDKYVFRGQLVDRAVARYHEDVLANREPDESAMTQAVFDYYYEHADEYEPTDENVLPREAASLARTFTRELAKRGTEVIAVQKKLWLYIGKNESGHDLPIPGDDFDPWSDGEGLDGNEMVLWENTDPWDWVVGFADLIEKCRDGIAVDDVKVTTRPVRSENSGVGKYKLQLFTYGSALWQAGHDVRLVRLLQQDPNQPAPLIEAQESFLESDYERTIRVYRGVRDHYLSLHWERWQAPPQSLIPYRGAGECTSRCKEWERCVFGGKREDPDSAL